MKKLKLAGIALGALLFFGLASQANAAINISVPSAPSPNYGLVSTSTGAYVSGLLPYFNATTYPGADIGAQIDNAYASCPTTGCEIDVPAGTYNFTTPIIFNTAGKTVELVCAAGGGHFDNSGTVLHWTSSTGTSTMFNTNNFVVAGMGVENCSFIGPAGTGGTGAIATSTYGVEGGGSNGAFGLHLDNVHISGFGTGLYIWQNVSFLNVTNSVINKNARAIWSPQTTGANGENMRVTNSVIADCNNNLFGASPANYCVDVQLSGNVQWQFVGNSFDDAQVYSEQFGGTANVWHFFANHWENPGAVPVSIYTAYDYISTLSNVPATEIITQGNDFMTDGTGSGALSEFIGGGADFISSGDTVDLCTSCGVNTSVPRFINNSNATAIDTISWTGLTNNGGSNLPAVTNVYGNIPYSPSGYGSGLGESFNIGSAVGPDVGTTTITDLGGVEYAPNFLVGTGADIGAQINAAYAALPTNGGGVGGGGIIQLPRGTFFFSTKINFGVNGKRVLLEGAPGEATSLFYTGTSGCAITINTGIQGAGTNHTSGNGIDGIFIHGNSYATTSPEVGVCVGGSNGTDGAVLNAVNTFHFGYGIETKSNAYHFLLENSTIRDNGQNIHIDSQGSPDNATNSGESMDFINNFIVDGDATFGLNPVQCFFVGDFGAASVNITGGSVDDCQISLGLQIPSFTMTGVHMENPGQATWGKYTYITIADSSFTNLDINGGIFMNDATSNTPTQFILSNGAGVVLNGLSLFNNGGSSAGTVNTLITGGHAVWSGLNNPNTGVTNIILNPNIPFVSSGSTATNAVDLGKLGISTTTYSGNLGIGTLLSTNGSSTISAGQWQIDGYNTSGVHTCTFNFGLAIVTIMGACNL